MKRTDLLLILGLVILLPLTLGVALAACQPMPMPAPPTALPIITATPTTPDAEPTLLVYNSVQRLLASDLLHTVTITDVQADLAGYPPDWPVVGVGTTNWIGRNGEMMPDGTAGHLHFWWADPGSPSQADVVDLAVRGPRSAVEFPFLALAIGDPATVITWTLRDVPDVHAWLEERLDADGIDLAGVQLRGEFGPVRTTVAYNIPLTGLDLSGGYVAEDVFRAGCARLWLCILGAGHLRSSLLAHRALRLGAAPLGGGGPDLRRASRAPVQPG